jgi:hypothetical protein
MALFSFINQNGITNEIDFRSTTTSLRDEKGIPHSQGYSGCFATSSSYILTDETEQSHFSNQVI